jgi:hypothetical protein
MIYITQTGQKKLWPVSFPDKGELYCGSLRPYLVIAVAAIDWSAFTWFKRYFGWFAALGTGYGEHLAMGFGGGIGAHALCSSGLAASRTALRFIGVAF